MVSTRGFTMVVFLCIGTFSNSFSGTISYGNRTSSSYDFLEIQEVSSLETYLGGNATNPVSTPVVLGNTLTFSPNTSLQVSTASIASSSGNATDHASTAFGFKIRAKTGQTIDQLKIDMTGTYNLFSVNLGGSTTSMAVVTINVPMTLQLFGVNGAVYAPATPLGFNLTVTPSSVTASSNGIGNVVSPSGIWTGTWDGAQVNGSFTKDLSTIFNIPTMDVTELLVTVTPDLNTFRSISDQNSASVFLTNASFAVIPEPSTSALVSVGLLVLLRRRSRS
jgi:hypothetical protein